MSDPYACASFHVEHVDKEYAAGARTEVEVQDPEGQHLEEEYEGADQEPELEQELTNFVDTQGKPRFMIPFKFKFMQAPVHDKTQYRLHLSLTIIAVLMHLSL